MDSLQRTLQLLYYETVDLYAESKTMHIFLQYIKGRDGKDYPKLFEINVSNLQKHLQKKQSGDALYWCYI